MDETEAEIDWLQQVLDVSHAGSGAHLRAAFDQEQRISARELTARLPAIFEMHLGVVTGDGAPLVAPVDGYLWRGRICFGVPTQSVRARLVRRNPRVSASFIADAVSFIVHGSFVELSEDHQWWSAFDAATRRLYTDQLGEWFNDWLDDKITREGRGVSGYIEPRVMFAKGPSPG